MNLQLGPAVGAIGIYDGYLDGELIVYKVNGPPPDECALLAAINDRWKFLRAMNARPSGRATMAAQRKPSRR